jgi:integrase
MRLNDINWNTGTLQVIEKGPIPSATAAPAGRRRRIGSLSGMQACKRRHRSRVCSKQRGVSSVVKQALKRANIETPSKGAHLLRHTAATEMLRNGVPLDQAGLVLRHRSIDMTAYYAKVDVALLKLIAQTVARGE